MAANGDVFVSQGHTPGPNGDARVLKFDKDGKFLTRGAARAPSPASSRWRTGWPSIPQGNCG